MPKKTDWKMIDINRALPVNPTLVPQELRRLPQWCIWRLVERGGGRPAKPPINAFNEKPLRVNALKGWGGFGAAFEAYEMDRLTYDGVGFLLTCNDPYVAIDLDKCRNPVTGKIKAWAMAIVKELQSYSEISPSETGLRIFIKVRNKSYKIKKLKAGNLEIFYSSSYVTVTGQHLDGTPEEIERRDLTNSIFYKKSFQVKQAPIKERVAPLAWSIPEANIIKRALAAKNGSKFKRLFLNGDDSGYHSASEADLALCGILAFWTRCDATMMDSIFRKSGLFRKEKWDKVHYRNRRTYGEATIATAISGCIAILGGE